MAGSEEGKNKTFWPNLGGLYAEERAVEWPDMLRSVIKLLAAKFC